MQFPREFLLKTWLRIAEKLSENHHFEWWKNWGDFVWFQKWVNATLTVAGNRDLSLSLAIKGTEPSTIWKPLSRNTLDSKILHSTDRLLLFKMVTIIGYSSSSLIAWSACRKVPQIVDDWIRIFRRVKLRQQGLAFAGSCPWIFHARDKHQLFRRFVSEARFAIRSQQPELFRTGTSLFSSHAESCRRWCIVGAFL